MLPLVYHRQVRSAVKNGENLPFLVLCVLLYCPASKFPKEPPSFFILKWFSLLFLRATQLLLRLCAFAVKSLKLGTWSIKHFHHQSQR